MFGQTNDSLAGSTFHKFCVSDSVSLTIIDTDIDHTLKEQGKESNHEYQEDTDDTSVDPLECRREVIASSCSKELSAWRVLANRKLSLQRTQEHH